MIHEVRNGAWVSRAFRPGSLLGDVVNDDRTPEQARFDALTERMARARCRHNAAHDAASQGGAHYAEHYAMAAAAVAEARTIQETAAQFLGPEEAERMSNLAFALVNDDRCTG